MYILKPPAAGCYTPPPLFYTPPTPRRVFSGVVGVGVYKIWPRGWFPDDLRKLLPRSAEGGEPEIQKNLQGFE